MQKYKIFVIPSILLIIVLLFFYFASLISSPASDETEDKEIIIEQGQGLSEISQNLKENGLIKNITAFKIYAYIEGVASRMQAGAYQLSTAMSIKEIVQVISQGQLLSNERTIKVLEGWNNREIAEYLAENELITQEDFLAATGVKDSREILPDESYDFLSDKDDTVDLEGYLYPDTYRIYKDSKAEDIIKKMLDNFDEKLTSELREEIKKQEKTIFEIIIMASILEKELSTYEDKQMGADLFYRRLEIGMALQSDATVNYATGKSERQPSYEDLQTVSPYNTYLNTGLPPGPICNPSIESIKAAIYPIPNEYYYYLHPEDGETVWSVTAEEHAENKAKYLD